MNVLVDTSVWSLFFRKSGPADHPAVEKLVSLVEENQDVTLTGVVLQEVLQAFRTDEAAEQVSDQRSVFSLLELRREDFQAAAKLHRRCRANGITAGTVDCQIAVAAINHDAALLTTDRDFEHIADLSDLRLTPY